MSPASSLQSVATAALQEACGERTPVDHRFFNELLLMGADINASCQRGDTPLMRAAQSGALDKVEYLIAAGADIARQRAHDGLTAEAVAHRHGHVHIASTLNQAGTYLRRQFAKARLRLLPGHGMAVTGAVRDAVHLRPVR
jgi:ankyrin repeat protein